jgi:hypothetical protein
MATIYACYISGLYAHFAATEAEAKKWASSHGEEFGGSYIQGQYTPISVPTTTAKRLLQEQPKLRHEEVLD